MCITNCWCSGAQGKREHVLANVFPAWLLIDVFLLAKKFKWNTQQISHVLHSHSIDAYGTPYVNTEEVGRHLRGIPTNKIISDTILILRKNCLRCFHSCCRRCCCFWCRCVFLLLRIALFILQKKHAHTHIGFFAAFPGNWRCKIASALISRKWLDAMWRRQNDNNSIDTKDMANGKRQS